MIGSLGGLTFQVSDKQVRTFRDLKGSQSANYSEHAIIGRKALLEFCGFGLSTLNMRIELKAIHGVKPYQELKEFRKMFKSSAPFIFILGEERVGENKWVITDYDVNYEDFDNTGTLLNAVIDVKLKEYVELDEEA